MAKVILLILFAELWGIAGQILYKKSANRAQAPDLRSPASYFKYVKELLSARTIWLGLSCVSIGLVVWLMALAQADLSFVFPIDSMQYILALVAAHFFLGEKINPPKLIGTLLIVGGIILVAMS